MRYRGTLPMDLTWDIDREGDASLVRCRVRNDDAVPRRVRIESRLGAPVLPPRRGGLPESGWDEAGVTLRLDPGERRALGFAARAPPTDPPVEIADVEAVDTTAESVSEEPIARDERAGSATAAALRRLGDHRPPRAATAGGAGELKDASPAERERSSSPTGDASPGESAVSDVDDDDTFDGGERDADPDDSPSASRGPTEWFDAVGTRLDAVEARIDRAERLTDADLAAATEAVAEADGVEELSGLDQRVAADATRLRELSERASALAARAAETEAPVEALEQLA